MSPICSDNKYGLRPILSAERLRPDHILPSSGIRNKDGSLRNIVQYVSDLCLGLDFWGMRTSCRCLCGRLNLVEITKIMG